jgi:hypothetical protein
VPAAQNSPVFTFLFCDFFSLISLVLNFAVIEHNKNRVLFMVLKVSFFLTYLCGSTTNFWSRKILILLVIPSTYLVEDHFYLSSSFSAYHEVRPLARLDNTVAALGVSYTLMPLWFHFNDVHLVWFKYGFVLP